MLHTIKLSRQMLLCAVCMSTEEEHKIYNNNNIIEKKKESHIFGYQPNHVIYTNLIRIYVSFSTLFYTRARCTRIFVKSAFLAGVCVCVCALGYKWEIVWVWLAFEWHAWHVTCFVRGLAADQRLWATKSLLVFPLLTKRRRACAVHIVYVYCLCVSGSEISFELICSH